MRSCLRKRTLLLLVLAGSDPCNSVTLVQTLVDPNALVVTDSKVLESTLECQATCLADPDCSYAVFEESTKLCEHINPPSLVGAGPGSAQIFCPPPQGSQLYIINSNC